MVRDVQRNAKIRGTDKVQVVDEAIRKHVKEVAPQRNAWQILDKYSGGKREQIENVLRVKFD